ncbi:MAG TPA: type IV pilus twitching motility protein PilT [Thermoanaerobaculia bacterium]|nr:type IV pilus twitching motility protein PilT [Thermoanaerobaculia bacterium]
MASGQEELLFGRLALHYKLITAGQLEEVHGLHALAGGRRRLPEILVEMGYLSQRQVDQLLVVQHDYLEKRRAAQAAVATGAPGSSATAAAATASSAAAPAPGAEPATARGAAAPALSPARAAAPLGSSAARPAAPYSPAASTVGSDDTVAVSGGAGAQGAPGSPGALPRVASAPGAPAPAAAASAWPAIAATATPWLGGAAGQRQLDAVLAMAVERGASDIHIHSGAPIGVRLVGSLVDLDPQPLAPAVAARMIEEVLDDGQRAALARHGQIDFAYTLPGRARFRANAYRQQRGLDAVFRSIPSQPPTLASLGLPESLARLADYHQGMVLITGPSGCGKSATMAALINIINHSRTEHIVTVEDPIEYIHPSRRGIVNQRQVGPHTASFARALRAALREDPDVIAIGELRDLETISLAITAAETGHLVLGTLHTNNSVRTINRMLGVFPPSQQGQMRTMISESLRAVVSQRLVARADGSGRVPALEVLVVTKAVANLIRESKTFQIRSILQTGAGHGMIQLDASLADLVRRGVVTRDEAVLHAEDPAKIP